MSGIAENALVFVGTYLRGDSKGIYAYRFDEQTGQLQVTGATASIPNPSFLATDSKGKFLYSVCEAAETDGKPTGAVQSFRILDDAGTLEPLNQVLSHGKAPCHVCVDATGKVVITANYSSGTIASFHVLDDGSLSEAVTVSQHEGSGPHERRQAGPHAHSVTIAPGNRFAYAADLGIDRIVCYEIDHATGKLTRFEQGDGISDPGAGPRHLAFHPDNRFLYVINELSSTVTAFNWDAATGKLAKIETVPTLPEDFEGNNTCADIHISADGRFLYGSNRGHDSIAVFAIAPETGHLTPISRHSTLGKNPRNFALSPSGKWLLAANQDGHNIVVYPIDAETGKLGTPVQNEAVPFPVCIRFVPECN